MASVRGRTSRLTLWVPFAAGGLLGGATTGLVLAVMSGLFSPLPPPVRLIVIALLAAGLLVLDLASAKLPLPQRSTLIPQTVFAAGMVRGIFRFGYEYGTGVRTLIPSAASYILAGALLLSAAPWWQILLIGALFGFSRTLPILQSLVLGGEHWAEFLSSHTRVLERLGSLVTTVLVAAIVLGQW
ncbi:MAG: hypothetical protein Q4G67_07690 [Actinomycetia bacterium]|nr:hypothetical protein [Actinomycetes bacterium]